MTWLWALLGGAGLYFYSKSKNATGASTAANNPGLNGSAQTYLATGNADAAAAIMALQGGVNGVTSLGTSIKNLWGGNSTTPAINNSPAAAPQNNGDDDGSDGSVDESYFDDGFDPSTGTLG